MLPEAVFTPHPAANWVWNDTLGQWVPQTSSSFSVQQLAITDQYGNYVSANSSGDMRVVNPARIAGSSFQAAQLDTNFWSQSVVGTGAVAQSNGVQTLSTGTTANSSVTVTSTESTRFVGQSDNLYTAIVQMGDTGTVNNTRKWGVFNTTDGCYFKLSGTTLYAATMKGGVETAIASTSWNGSQVIPTLTNGNYFRIIYKFNTVIFEINGTVAHTATFNSAPFGNTINLPLSQSNANSGGGTTNVSMTLWTATVTRLGPIETQPKYFHGAAAGTTVLKYSAGNLHRIVINTFQSSGSATLTLYDNTSATGSVIAVISGPAQAQPTHLEFHVAFSTGLTVVAVGTWDFTVVYE